MSGMTASEPKTKRRVGPIDLTLRTQQLQYLEYLAERDELPLSRALARIIDRCAEVPWSHPVNPTKKARKHFFLAPKHIALLDQLSVIWGLPRSDVARRLIDEALEKDTTL
jgi:hypothetical protein